MKKGKMLCYGLLRFFSNLFLILSNRLLFCANFFRERLYFAFEYEERADDIYLSSYPKAGSTALQMMLYQMTSNGSMGIEHISTVIPWLEEVVLFNPGYINELKSPRIFKTHRVYKYLPKNGKVIYIVRNIKDTCVSYFHHLMSDKGYFSETFDSYFDFFIKGTVPWGTWSKHLKSWWPHRRDDRVLFLYYDELKNNPEAVVRKIDRFCGFKISEEKIQDIVVKNSIQNMKKYNHLFDPRLSAYRRSGQENFKKAFIRKGVIDGWKEKLNDQQEATLDAITVSTLKKLKVAPSDDGFHIFKVQYEGSNLSEIKPTP